MRGGGRRRRGSEAQQLSLRSAQRRPGLTRPGNPRRSEDAGIFSGNLTPVRDVMVAGAWVVRNGRHRAQQAIAAAFSGTMRRLADTLWYHPPKPMTALDPTEPPENREGG